MSVTAAVGFGVGAAACFAVATAAQHRSAGDVPEAGGLQPRAVVAFARATLRQPLWLLGVGADLVGLTCHVLALGQGSLALVQPLLISGLLFALPARQLLEHRGPTRAELLMAALLVAGLSVFLLAADPVGGDTADRLPAVLLAVGLALAAGVLLSAGRRRTAQLRAVLYGSATGVAFGATAALIKSCTNAAAHGWPHLFTSPALWLLLAVGPAGLVINQLAFQAGPLTASLPALAVIDPLVSLAAGLLVFDERLSSQPDRIAAAIAGLIVVVAAGVALSRREALPAGQ